MKKAIDKSLLHVVSVFAYNLFDNQAIIAAKFRLFKASSHVQTVKKKSQSVRLGLITSTPVIGASPSESKHSFLGNMDPFVRDF